jgi:hypothetical protein
MNRAFAPGIHGACKEHDAAHKDDLCNSQIYHPKEITYAVA